MIWWFAVPAIGSLFWDGPWLLIAFGIQWLLKWGYPHGSLGFFVAELGGLGLLEWLFHQWLPPRPVQRSPGRLLEESWILIWLSLLLSPIPGFIVWQGTVGFDAAARLHGFRQDVPKVLRVRVVKMLVIIGLAIFLALTR
ncbi:hypothetical protein [Sulfobacillus thermosulfidooxidans]|uniref:hypothetical protein n=1 Tax=Sulfobacillus thermosulfidooxidans TaxID=28034 RepID=UPI00096BBDCF|nr:hypothetical protein [Sulfobacillus thermosulfidooxidans]OLZ08608.1 hypothetical protein BFX05_03540 [Sulfobacillus thermosulfidooxidans]OLZ13211.1 hypothetical protein BFX06_11790 [Sulfobacillus thermosulfidooxidans]OLZ21591.1 hypothetical protein BFX07_12215 [Sulfobacillus thermosulfidooxidans]